MKIVQVNTGDTGGAFQAAYRLQHGLQTQGVTSDFLVLYQQRKELHDVQEFLGNQSFISRIKHSVRFNLLQRKIDKAIHGKPAALFRFPYSPFRIQEHPLVRQSDIVHLHWMAKFLDYPTFFREIKQPVVWTLHDTNPFNGGFNYESYALPEYQQLDAMIRAVKKTHLAQADNLHIIGISKWILRLSQQSELLGRFPHHYIPNGIDVSVFKPSDKMAARRFFNLPLDKKIILFVAEALDDKRKGFAFLEESLRLLSPESALLVTLGKGSVSSHLPVHSLGFISDPERIALAYAAADIFVIPSLEDNLPNSVMEAIACGTPVAGFEVGGIPDMVRHGENGLLAAAQDSTQLGNHMLQLLSDDIMREKMGLRAREIAIAEYSLEIQAKRHMALYTSLLQGR